MSLSDEIQISLQTADDRLQLTIERANQFLSEAEANLPSQYVMLIRTKLADLFYMHEEILSYRSGLKGYIIEQEVRFLHSTRELIKRLDEIDTCLVEATDLQSKLHALNSICPLWPFC